MEKRVSFIGNSPALPGLRVDLRDGIHRIFLVSPAKLKGVRGQRLLNTPSDSELGKRLCAEGASLAELFSYTSALYFRGKLAYARYFAKAPADIEACYIITSTRGLLTPETVVNLEEATALASGGDIDLEDDRYRIPLRCAAVALEQTLPPNCQVVLLGSVATEKYVVPLAEVFGARLLFPTVFRGRGDMGRGSLLLRCVRENRELAYSVARVSGRKSKRI